MRATSRPDAATLERARRAVDDAVNTVIDPCSTIAGVPAGLVDMGLVRNVEIAPGQSGLTARISIAVTHPSCFMAPIFLQQVEEAVRALPDVTDVTVVLDADADWVPEDMSAAYREQLASHRTAAGRLPVVPAGPKRAS